MIITPFTPVPPFPSPPSPYLVLTTGVDDDVAPVPPVPNTKDVPVSDSVYPAVSNAEPPSPPLVNVPVFPEVA